MNLDYVTAQEAVQMVKSGDRVFIHGSAATPLPLVNALLDRAGEITNVELVAITMYGPINWNRQEVLDNIYLNSLFVSENVREWVNCSDGSYTPVFLSEIPGLFAKGVLPLDVAMVHVSPPDKHGYCTLGTSVDVALSAVHHARKVIAMVNPRMPRVLGDGVVHISKFTTLVYEETELPEVNYALGASDISDRIGRHVATLIDDGATLQMGIGTIPDAVLGQLHDRCGLGIHTEMFSDGVIDLVEKGVITNEHKVMKPGKIVTGFVMGTRRLYDFVDNNPIVSVKDISWVNDTDIIRRNPKVVAINSAIEIDITGQVCADSIGTRQYSGIGGQMDFIRGAALSEGGKPIIALPSMTNKGVSRIVPVLKEGAGVVTTRGHVHYVATEHGVVNLYGKNMEQRAKLLISIADHSQRGHLEEAYYKRFGKLLNHVTV